MFEISVIIATCGRPQHLARCLERLALQRLAVDLFEVIVTVDGSDLQTVKVLESFVNRLHLRWVVTEHRKGPAAARNRSLRRAQAPIIAITDDDCEPDEGWLHTFYTAFQVAPDLGVAIGRTVTDPTRLTPFSHYVTNQNGEGHQTCNIAFRRHVLDQLGGFDEGYPGAYLEDTELFCRAQSLTVVEFTPKALVVHPPRELSPLNLARTAFKYESDFIFYRKHPVLYRSRHRGAGPVKAVLWCVSVKHVLKQLVRESSWLRRDPRVFSAYGAAMLLFVFIIWTHVPFYCWKHRSAGHQEVSEA